LGVSGSELVLADVPDLRGAMGAEFVTFSTLSISIN